MEDGSARQPTSTKDFHLVSSRSSSGPSFHHFSLSRRLIPPWCSAAIQDLEEEARRNRACLQWLEGCGVQPLDLATSSRTEARAPPRVVISGTSTAGAPPALLCLIPNPMTKPPPPGRPMKKSASKKMSQNL